MPMTSTEISKLKNMQAVNLGCTYYDIMQTDLATQLSCIAVQLQIQLCVTR